MIMDQAEDLRKEFMVKNKVASKPMQKIITIASGKGGTWRKKAATEHCSSGEKKTKSRCE